MIKKLVFLATGGVAHNLFLLGNSIKFASKFNYKIYPFYENCNSFRVNFSDIYSVRNKKKILFLENEEVEEFIFQKTVKLKNIYLKHLSNYTYVVESINHDSNYLKLSQKRVFTNLYFTTGHFKNRFNYFPIVARIKRRHGIHKALMTIMLVDEFKEFLKISHADINQPYIGVHFRNTDMKHNLRLIILKLKLYSRVKKIKTVYWATDDPNSLKQVKVLLPDLNIINLANIDKLESKSFLNIHNLSDFDLEDAGLTKFEQIRNVFLDIYILARSHYFISSNKSGFSLLIKLFRSNKSPKLWEFFN